MSEPLAETEALCREIVAALSSSDRTKTAQTLKGRIEVILPKLSESRKKLMTKSPKGRELSAEVAKNAAKLRELAVSSKGKLGDDISQQLGLLESSVSKLEIYWKSFEYVTT